MKSKINGLLYKEVGTFTSIDEINYDNKRIGREYSYGKIYKNKIKRNYIVSIDNTKFNNIPLEKTDMIGKVVFHSDDKDLKIKNKEIDNWLYNIEITKEYKKSILKGLELVNSIIDKVYDIDYISMQKMHYCVGLYETKYFQESEKNPSAKKPLLVNAILVDIYNRYNQTNFATIEEVFADKNFWNVITGLKKYEGVSIGAQLKLEGSDAIYRGYPWYDLLSSMELPKLQLEMLNER